MSAARKEVKSLFARNEKGLALPAVIIIVAILLIICASALYVTNNQALTVDRTKTSEDALHIAEAGYYRYLWQLNDNSDFYKLPKKVVDEFEPIEFYSGSEQGANPLWAGYPKKYRRSEYRSGNKLVGYYQIEIVPPSTAQPVVTIRSTGWVANRLDIKRTIEVKVHKRQFTNYINFSGDMKDENGNIVYWGTGTHVHGPVFTNGSLYTLGTPVFYDTVTYCKDWVKRDGNPEFKKPGQPVKGKPLAFPASNADIVYWAENGGYVYTGRTCILLNGNELKIRNPLVSNDAIVTRPLPPSNVIHVKGDLFISGKLDGRLTVVADGTIYITGKDPTNFNYNSAESTGGITYANQNIPTLPDQEITNQSDDMLGLISNSKVLINTSCWPDVAPKYVNKSAGKYALNDINVHAVLMGISSDGYFGADEYEHLGRMGYIRLVGSTIFGRVGATRVTSIFGYNGYLGDYYFDYRLAYETPPHFLEPANSGWEIREWKEITTP